VENKNETFTYSYSTKQQEEAKNIRQKYMPREENKMEQLRRLDKSAEKPGTIASLIIGIIGALLLGIGMVCTLVWVDYFILGIVVGVLGIAGVAVAYPVFFIVTKKQREKLAPQIMKLSDELIHGK
jgi:hypothetical protein